MDYRILNESSYLHMLKDFAKRGNPKRKKEQLLSEADEPEVEIEVEHPGILEVPKGKDVDDLGIDHFKDLVKKKGYEEISRALTNLHVWNKDREPSLANWADGMQNKLKDWVEKKREEDPDFAK